jgi:hypothetical protein
LFIDGRNDVSSADADILGPADRGGIGRAANEKVNGELGRFPDIEHESVGATGPKRLGGGTRDRVDEDLSLVIINQSVGHNTLWQVGISRQADALSLIEADGQNAKFGLIDLG